MRHTLCSPAFPCSLWMCDHNSINNIDVMSNSQNYYLQNVITEKKEYFEIGNGDWRSWLICPKSMPESHLSISIQQVWLYFSKGWLLVVSWKRVLMVLYRLNRLFARHGHMVQNYSCLQRSSKIRESQPWLVRVALFWKAVAFFVVHQRWFCSILLARAKGLVIT